MIDVLELFDGIKNVEFVKFVDPAAVIPVFRIVEPTPLQWNEKARIQNTKMFIEITGKQPKDYDEVKCWIEGNKKTTVQQHYGFRFLI